MDIDILRTKMKRKDRAAKKNYVDTELFRTSQMVINPRPYTLLIQKQKTI